MKWAENIIKKVIQTVSYLPRFLSTVVVVGMGVNFLSPSSGIVNIILNKCFGMEPIFFMSLPEWFRSIFTGISIWQGTGWNAIIYIAALSGIDPQLYEAAIIDGAGRFKQMIYVTLPCLMPTIVIMLLLNLGQILNIGFESIILLYIPMIYETADVIGTFVYRRGIINSDYSFSTAVGLFQSIIGFITIMVSNKLSQKFTDTGIMVKIMTKVLKIKKKINKSIGSNAFDIFNFIILTLFMLSILYPLVFIFSVSLSDRLSVLKNEVFIFPIGANLESYRKIFQEDLFVHSYFNTILYTVLGTLACVIINALTAYPLSKKRLKGGTFVMMAITFTMLFSGGLIPYYLLIRNLGMIDTIWVLIIPGALVPMYVIIMRTFFQNLPPELEESAEIDGCNDFQTFIRIIIPLSKPVMATISLFAAVASWNSYFSPLIFLNTQGKVSIAVVFAFYFNNQ